MADMEPLQSLQRGLALLDVVSLHPDGIAMTDLASLANVNRTIAYRIVGTLAGQGLVDRGGDGKVRLSFGARVLGDRYLPRLIGGARPVLGELAKATGMTAHLSVPEGDQCVAALVVEPPDSVIHVTYREGSRHPLSTGAAGLAILAARGGRSPALDEITERGYALTAGQLQEGAVGLAIALRDVGGVVGSIGVVALGVFDEKVIAAQVVHARDRLCLK